eukprot:s236_g7.t1
MIQRLLGGRLPLFFSVILGAKAWSCNDAGATTVLAQVKLGEEGEGRSGAGIGMLGFASVAGRRRPQAETGSCIWLAVAGATTLKAALLARQGLPSLTRAATPPR